MTNFVQSHTLTGHMSAERAEMVGNAKTLPGGLLASFVDAVKRLLDRESAASASWDAWYMWGL